MLRTGLQISSYGHCYKLIDWYQVCWARYYSIFESRQAIVRINNLAMCLAAATEEYARWRASMRELFGWKFEGTL